VWLYVAVDYIAFVRGPQGLGHLERHRRGRVGRERATPQDAVFQGAARQILHRDVVRPIFGLAPVEDRNDVRVGEGRGVLGLAFEALHELPVARVAGAHNLQGHVPVEDVVVGQKDVCHAAATQRSQEPVTVVYELLHEPGIINAGARNG
jgi:hypothetical protein